MLNVREIYTTLEAYEDERYRFIELMEGSVGRIYTDSYGIPTVGIGHAFNKDISKEKAEELIGKAFNNQSFTLTDAQWTRLSETITLGWAAKAAYQAATQAKNVGDTAEEALQITIYEQKRDAAQAKILTAKSNELHGTYVTANDNMGIEFNSSAIKNIFDEDIKTYEARVSADNLSNSKERVAIVSLLFNGVNARDTIDLVNSATPSADQRAKIWFEIRYRSNFHRLSSDHRRRIDESEEFGLYSSVDGKTPQSDNEAKQVIRFLESKRAWIQSYLNAVPKYNIFDLNTALAPAKTLLIENYSQGVEIDGDIIVGQGIGESGEAYADKTIDIDDTDLKYTDKNDLIFGERGDDTLIGGAGADVLYGGDGNDTYITDNGDTILDSDHQGKVTFEDIELKGAVWNPWTGEYESISNKNETYTLDNDTLTITHEDKTLTIKNYSKEDKSLSIDLNSYLTLEIEDARFKEGDDTHNEKIGFKLVRVLSDGTTMTHKAAQDMVYTFQIGSASYTGEIKKGNSGGYVEFTIHGDTVEEEDEKLQVKLMNPPSDPEGNPIEVSATITIKDDDDDDDDDEPEKPEDEIPSHPWQHGTPLVLDLNNDGITSQSIQTNKQYFDLNNDGIKESMAWIQKSDGILVLDKDSNFLIKDGNELFGNYTKLANGAFAPNGFEALKELDENKDGIIDAKDAIYKDLRVWIDANQDALNNEGELRTLEEIGITSINLNYDNVNLDENGNKIKQTSTFTRYGWEYEIRDVYFQMDFKDTASNSVEDAITKAKGTGDVANLSYVAEHNEAIKQKVLTLQEAINNQSSLTTLKVMAKDLLIHWAGVEKISGQNNYMSAGRSHIATSNQDLALVEKFDGEKFYTNMGGTLVNKVQGPAAHFYIRDKVEYLVNKTLLSVYAHDLFGSEVFGDDESFSYSKIKTLIQESLIEGSLDAKLLKDMAVLYVDLMGESATKELVDSFGFQSGSNEYEELLNSFYNKTHKISLTYKKVS